MRMPSGSGGRRKLTPSSKTSKVAGRCEHRNEFQITDRAGCLIHLCPLATAQPLCPGRPISDRQLRHRECHPFADPRPKDLSLRRQSRRCRQGGHRILLFPLLKGRRRRRLHMARRCFRELPLRTLERSSSSTLGPCQQ